MAGSMLPLEFCVRRDFPRGRFLLGLHAGFVFDVDDAWLLFALWYHFVVTRWTTRWRRVLFMRYRDSFLYKVPRWQGMLSSTRLNWLR